MSQPGEGEEYEYRDRGTCSSDKYRIEVGGLPNFYGITELKKLMNLKLGLNTSKIKRPKYWSHCILACFRTVQEQTEAIAALNGYNWKGNNLTAKEAPPPPAPVPDPFVRRRKLEEENATSAKKRKEDEEKSQAERLKDAITPYWNIPYEEQLKIKQNEIKQILLSFDEGMWKRNENIRKQIEDNRKVYDGLSFELMPIQKSPKIEGYRNKCEFTCGIDNETKEPTVGFRQGTYVSGMVEVAPIHEHTFFTEKMKKACSIFQDYMRKSGLLTYSPSDYSGYWRHLIVRQSTATGEVMLIVVLNPQKMTTEELEQMKQKLVEHFSSVEAKECNITSLYYQLHRKKSLSEEDKRPVHLMGATHITDNILGRSFRILPETFFQINGFCVDILYQSAIDMSRPKENTTVIDICCGAGTIGLCFAKHCSQVLGLDRMEEAVKDAKANAEHNNITNCDFFAGKAEDILPTVVARAPTDDIIAIVDPPRTGLRSWAITHLRNAKKLNRLVYITSHPANALKNFIDLVRPFSKPVKGAPFMPVRAVPVDMFPMATHVVLAFLFERVPQDSKSEEKVEDNAESADNASKPSQKEQETNGVNTSDECQT